MKTYLKYLITGIIMTIITAISIWILTDLLNIHTFISSNIIIGFFFIIKYYIYKNNIFKTKNEKTTL